MPGRLESLKTSTKERTAQCCSQISVPKFESRRSCLMILTIGTASFAWLMVFKMMHPTASATAIRPSDSLLA